MSRKFSDLLFEIRGKPGTRMEKVHHDRLKRYHSDSLPDWLTSKSKLQLGEEQDLGNRQNFMELISGERERKKE